MGMNMLGRRNKLKDLKVLHNFNQVDGRDVEDPTIFSEALVQSG